MDLSKARCRRRAKRRCVIRSVNTLVVPILRAAATRPRHFTGVPFIFPIMHSNISLGLLMLAGAEKIRHHKVCTHVTLEFLTFNYSLPIRHSHGEYIAFLHVIR